MRYDDGSWENVFLGNERPISRWSSWNRGRTSPYDSGGRDTHLAFEVDDMDAARAIHEEMGCVCFVNERMGIYFIEIPTAAGWKSSSRSRGVASAPFSQHRGIQPPHSPQSSLTAGGIPRKGGCRPHLKRVGIFGNARVNRVGNGCTKRKNRAGNAWQLR